MQRKMILHFGLCCIAALMLTACSKKDDKKMAPVVINRISFDDLKKLSASAPVTVPNNTKINGVVISDAGNKNIAANTVVLQEATGKAGLIVTFGAAPALTPGDSVEINISNQTLAQVNGEVVLQNIVADSAHKVGTGSITAMATNAADVTKNAAAWDGTLVTIPATEMTGGNGNYTGTLSVKDSTGTVTSDIATGAAFENTAYPASVSTFTGIVRVNGNTVSIDIRKTDDVVTGAITRIVTENFANLSPADIYSTPPRWEFGFSTTLGTWPNAGWGVMPGATYDADFTTAGRTYVYLGATAPDYSNAQIYFGNPNYVITDLANLKQISITFAGSKMSGSSIPEFNNQPVPAFDPTTDYFQLGFYPTNVGYGQIAQGIVDKMAFQSSQVTQTGVFTTITWTLPTRDQWKAAGVTDDQLSLVDDWMQKPEFLMRNQSTRKAGGTLAPIVLDKVAFKF